MAKLGICQYCGVGGTVENHHIFGGKNRNISDKYDCMQIFLCYKCHRQQPTGVHGGNKKLDLFLKRKSQKEFEKKYSHEKFMEEIGRNYI
ncbi:MAG: hypothetical protein ACQEQF_00765 [Bacillota bacterium]